MNENFKKASELFHLKNNVVITDELKDKLSHLENVNISEINEYSKLSISKESYKHPSMESLHKR